MKAIIFTLLFLVIDNSQVFNTLISGIETGAFQISDVHRKIDLSGPVKIITTSMTIKNTQDKQTDTFNYILEPFGDISLLKFKTLDDKIYQYQKLNDIQKALLESDKTTILQYIQLKLPIILLPSESISLNIIEYYTNHFSPLPETNLLTVISSIECKGYTNIFSAYVVKNQILEYYLMNDSKASISQQILIRYTKTPYSKLEGNNKIIYTLNNPIEPLFFSEFIAQFISETQFMDIVKMHRQIYISEYNNIQVVDHFVVYNRATNHTGEFNRLFDYSNLKNIITKFIYTIDSKSIDLAYYDLVGHISTIETFKKSDNKLVVLQPRFPLLGGWNTEFTFSYKVPVEKYLKCSNNEKREFEINILPNIESIGQVSELDLEVIFPEYSEHISFTAPTHLLPVKSNRYKTYSYLDIFGRKTINLKYNNLVDEHKQSKIKFNYYYKSDNLYLKPLYITFVLFISMMIMSLLSRLSSYFNLFKKTTHGIKHEYENLLKIFDDFIIFFKLGDKILLKRLKAINDFSKDKNIKNLSKIVETTESKLTQMSGGMSDVLRILVSKMPDSKNALNDVVNNFNIKSTTISKQIEKIESTFTKDNGENDLTAESNSECITKASNDIDMDNFIKSITTIDLKIISALEILS